VKLPFDQYTLAPLFRKIQKDLANIADITSNEFDGAGISLVWRLTDPLLSRAVTGPGPPYVDADGPGPLSCNPLKKQCISRRRNFLRFRVRIHSSHFSARHFWCGLSHIISTERESGS
jgi:hypothetical protein